MLVRSGISLLLSPLPLLWILVHTKKQVDGKLFIYLRNALPSPSNPDQDSIEAAINGELTHGHILGLSRNRRSLRQMIEEDFESALWMVEDVRKLLKSWLDRRKTRIVQDATNEGSPGPELQDARQIDLGEVNVDINQPSDSESVVDFISSMQSSPPEEEEPQPSSNTDTVGSPDTRQLREDLQAASIVDLPEQWNEAPHVIEEEVVHADRPNLSRKYLTLWIEHRYTADISTLYLCYSVHPHASAVK